MTARLSATLPALLERQAEALGDRAVPAGRRDPQAFRRDARRGRADWRGRSPRRASSAATASRSCAENRVEVVDAWFAAPWLGAILVPFNTATRGPQLEHVLTNSGPRVLAVEEGSARHLDVVERAAADELERLWLLDAARDKDASAACPSSRSRLPASAVPAEPTSAPASTVAILYTSGTTGPSKGVMCPQAQFYWWARSTAAMLGGLSARRRPLHVPAAVPHERAQRVHAGADPRGAVRRRPALLRVALLGPARRGRRDGHLPARRDGLDPRQDAASRPPRREHRVRVALAPATPAESARRVPRALRRRCSSTASA